GALWTYVDPPAFKLLTGEGELTDYQFNKHNIHHLFCATCGVASFARGSSTEGGEGIAINVRCLDDIDLASLTLTPFDGRSLCADASAGPVLRRTGLDDVPRLGAFALRPRRDDRLRLRPAPRGRADRAEAGAGGVARRLSGMGSAAGRR